MNKEKFLLDMLKGEHMNVRKGLSCVTVTYKTGDQITLQDMGHGQTRAYMTISAAVPKELADALKVEAEQEEIAWMRKQVAEYDKNNGK